MIIVQTRRIPLDHYSRTDSEVPWQEALRRPNFREARADIMTLMQKIGFTPFSEVCLLVDDLNPARWQGDPERNILTTDEGMEIRTLMELACMTCVEVTEAGDLHTGVLRGTVGFGPVVAGMQSYKLACGHVTV